MHAHTHTNRRGGMRAGFTLMEMLLALLVLFVLMGLLISGARLATGAARRAADRAAAAGLRQAVVHFRQQMGFIPPLVMDLGPPPNFAGGPLVGTAPDRRPQVYLLSDPNHLAFLRTPFPPQVWDPRFSIYSLAYYVVGVLEEDGVPGPGFRAVRRDGSFERQGRTFDPLFDTSRGASVAELSPAGAGRIVLRDRNGVAFRYYRWEHGNAATGEVNSLADLNVPLMVGDPAEQIHLRTATFAVVAAGPNGLFGNEHQLPPDHPQYMDLEQMMSRLGIRDQGSLAANIARVWREASSDNIIEVGQ